MPRRSERILYNGDIKLDWSSGNQETRISDISVEGCYIDSTSAVNQGETLAFELTRPDGGSIRFTGTVAYVLDGFGFGVHFTNVTDEQKAVVQQILANQ